MVESSDEDYADDYDDDYSSDSDSNNTSNDSVVSIHEHDKESVTNSFPGHNDRPEIERIPKEDHVNSQTLSPGCSNVDESNSNILFTESKSNVMNQNKRQIQSTSDQKSPRNKKASPVKLAVYSDHKDQNSKNDSTNEMSINFKEETVNESIRHDDMKCKSDGTKSEQKIHTKVNPSIQRSNHSLTVLSTQIGEDEKRGARNDHLQHGTDENDVNFKIWEYSKQLVQEGEKNVKLAQHLEQSKEKIKILNQNIDEIRQAMLYGINGSVDILDIKEKYGNIPLVELLRIRLQTTTSEVCTVYKPSKSKRSRRRQGDCIKPIHHDQHHQLMNRNELNVDRPSDINVGVQHQLTSGRAKQSNSKYHEEEIVRLQKKIRRMVERSRQDRESRSKLEKELSIENERVEALSDHVEKLMVHLKHEVIAKAKALAERSRTQKEVELLKTRNETMAKRDKRKEMAIMELKDGSRILEDQLRLMDEKYMELRMKLDWTRIQTERLIKTKEEETRQLRAKFALVSDNGNHTTKKNAKNVLLDEYEFPSHNKVMKKKDKGDLSSKKEEKKSVPKTGEKGGILLGNKLPSTDGIS